MRVEIRCIVALVAASACQAVPPEGRWEGAVEIPQSRLRLVVDLTKDALGAWTGSAIVPGFGVKGAPLDAISVKDSKIVFRIKNAMGEPKLTAHLNAEGALAGTYEQGGRTAPFLLRRTGEPQVDLPRASTAIRKDREGEWQGTMEVAGNKISVVLKLANQPGGKASGELSMQDAGGATAPLDLVVEDGDELRAEVSRIGAVYEGRFAGGEINGVFRQGGFEVPLNFQRKK